MQFPRVLVISPTRLGTQTATGIAMTSLFRYWPRDFIAQIHTDFSSQFDHEVCHRYYYLNSPIEKVRWVPVLGNVWAGLLGANGIVRQHIRFKDVLSWVRRFDPEVIYYRAIDRPAFYWWLGLKLARALHIPLITHIMDDWPARLESSEGIINRYVLRPRLQRHFQDLLRHSIVRLSICEKMSQAFEARYGVEFFDFQNSIDIEEWSTKQNSFRSKPNEYFRIVYAGSLAFDMQLWSMKDVAEIISGLHMRGVKIGFDIYTADWWRDNFREYLEGMPGVRYAGFVPRADFPRILIEADLLVLPINFDVESLKYVRYSMANKVPEYMASGTPILVYGPLEAATVNYAEANGWGYIVSERNKEKLERAIVDLMSWPQKRVELGEYARQLAFRNHDAGLVRKRFQELVCSTARTFPADVDKNKDNTRFPSPDL